MATIQAFYSIFSSIGNLPPPGFTHIGTAQVDIVRFQKAQFDVIIV